MTYLPIDWIAAALGLAGMWLLPSQKKTAIVLFLAGNALWLAWGLSTGSNGVIANYIIMGCLNARTLIKWMRDERTVKLELTGVILWLNTCFARIASASYQARRGRLQITLNLRAIFQSFS